MDKSKPPRVFISYSHDSADHKQWVCDLATNLRGKGVDIIFYGWGLSPGDDVPKFMERCLTEADRVLMICTSAYVHRANDGKGGVGYEAMIVTSQLVKDLGTSKFIPILRQAEGQRDLPTSVATRFFIDLSEHKADDYDGQLDALLRELHQVPANPMPPIGKNPFGVSPSGENLPKTHTETTVVDHLLGAEEPDEFYQLALRAAKDGDLLSWRHLVRKARRVVGPDLQAWRKEYEVSAPGDTESLLNQSLEGIEAFSPLFCIALAGIGSGRSDFTNQTGLLDVVLHPDSWNIGGLSVVTTIPEAAAFVYQALSGAMCIYTAQYAPVIQMVRSSIETAADRNAKPLWSRHEIVGWPTSFNNSDTAWAALISLPERWPWLLNVFGDKEDFYIALVAYHLFLNINEYSYTIAEGKESQLSDETYLDTPLAFMAASDGVRREAYTLLAHDLSALSQVWHTLKVSDERVCAHWATWMTVCRSWHSRSGTGWRNSSGRMPHSRLADDITAGLGGV